MIYTKTAPFSLSKKTAHSSDITDIADEMKQRLQTDSENPAFEKLANNPMVIEKKRSPIEDKVRD